MDLRRVRAARRHVIEVPDIAGCLAGMHRPPDAGAGFVDPGPHVPAGSERAIVAVESLVRLLARGRGRRVDFLKMDIDGSGCPVLLSRIQDELGCVRRIAV